MPRRFALGDLPATPWKNGGGSTREIACWPPGAGLDDFAWRVSLARIAADGPFSRFAGVDRIITLLEGDGVRLRGPGVDHRLDRPLAPFAFSGDTAIACTLLGGPSSDFNVMTRRRPRAPASALLATLQVLHGAAELPPARHGLLLAWRGAWHVAALRLATGQGLWWAETPQAWRVATGDADAALLAVQWHPLPH